MLGIEFFGDHHVGEHDLGHGESSREKLKHDKGPGVLGEGGCSGEHRVGDDGEKKHLAPPDPVGDHAEEKGGQGAESDDGTELAQLVFGNEQLGLDLLEREAKELKVVLVEKVDYGN